MRTPCLAIACALAILPAPVLAGTPVDQARMNAATALVESIQIERQADSMFVGLKGLFAENAIAAMLRDDKSGDMARFFAALPGGRDRFAQVLADEFVTALRKRYPDMKKVTAEKYAEIFSLQELEQLNVFFGGGVGGKWLANSSKIEAALGEWGHSAGMKAGIEALGAAMAKIEPGQTDKDKAE